MPNDARKWTVTAWHCSCHAVEWHVRPPMPWEAPTAPAGVVGGLFSYRTVDEFLADGHADLTPVGVDDVAALLAEYRDLTAEHAKTVSNFEEFAESVAEGQTIDGGRAVAEPQQYRLSGEVRAVQWTGDNAAELEAFAGPNFDALTEPCDDDPDATAAVLGGGHSTWQLLYTGDWVTRGVSGGEFYAVRQADFDAMYVLMVDGDRVRAEVEAHEGELGDMRAALSAAEADRDREYQRAEGWADQYNRVARQIADLRDERDTALADAKQARADLTDSRTEFWAVVEERDRRGDELRRAQAVIDAAKAWYAACDPRAITAADVRAASIRLAAAIDALEAPVPP